MDRSTHGYIDTHGHTHAQTILNRPSIDRCPDFAYAYPNNTAFSGHPPPASQPLPVDAQVFDVNAFIHSFIHSSYMHACMHACIHTYPPPASQPLPVDAQVFDVKCTYVHSYMHRRARAGSGKSPLSLPGLMCLCSHIHVYAYIYIHTSMYIHT